MKASEASRQMKMGEIWHSRQRGSCGILLTRPEEAIQTCFREAQVITAGARPASLAKRQPARMGLQLVFH